MTSRDAGLYGLIKRGSPIFVSQIVARFGFVVG